MPFKCWRRYLFLHNGLSLCLWGLTNGTTTIRIGTKLTPQIFWPSPKIVQWKFGAGARSYLCGNRYQVSRRGRNFTGRGPCSRFSRGGRGQASLRPLPGGPARPLPRRPGFDLSTRPRIFPTERWHQVMWDQFSLAASPLNQSQEVS